MKKRRVLFILSIALLIVLTACLAACDKTKAKDFSKAGMTITLTSSFVEKDYASLTGYYESKSAIVTVLKEENSIFTENGLSADMTLTEYAQLIINQNMLTGITPSQDDGVTNFTYYKTVSGKNFGYFATVHKSADAYWLIQFGCEKDNFDDMKDKFMSWAKTVVFDQPYQAPEV